MQAFICFPNSFMLIWFDRIEEYIDYLFPDETQTTNLKILEAAYKWKKQKLSSGDD